MVFTLQRYIFREVFKVFVLATVALTLILSLGSILRPVAEYGVGPRQVVHLIGYFLPITLTFVLPMAALFSTALVYGRFASDNELDACRASGVSMLTLVYPGLALAVMVAIANLTLSFHVVPAFVHRAETSLKADAKQILFRNIQRRGYYKPPGTLSRIYADCADSQNNTLLGVVIAEVKGSEIKKIITAENAKIHFNPHKRFNEVQIAAHNAYQMAAGDEGDFSAKSLLLMIEFPSLLGDDIKFKKIDEIKKIRLDPMQFYPIEKLAGDVYAQFLAELLAQDISSHGRHFYKLYSGSKIVEFTASDCVAQDEEKVRLSGDVVVNEFDSAGKQFLRTLRCTKAILHIEGDKLAPTLTMELYSARWQCADGSEGLARRPIIRGLILPRTVTDKFKTGNVLNDISPASVSAALKNGPSPGLERLQNKLQRKIWNTSAEIKAEIHSRLVFGIGCVPLIMIGIGLGIILKGGHLLSAFGASSIPAAVLTVFIMMGRNVTKNPDSLAGSGVTLMWVGLILLSLLAVVVYRKLLKN